MRGEIRPARCPQHQDTDRATGQILLVPKILVGRDVEIEPGGLRCFDQRAVRQLRPPTLKCRLNFMGAKRASEWHRRALIKQDSQIASPGDGETAARMFENGVNLLACHARKPREKVGYRRPTLEILKKRAHGHTGRPKEPLAADFPGDSFHRWAFVPVEHGRSVLTKVGWRNVGCSTDRLRVAPTPGSLSSGERPDALLPNVLPKSRLGTAVAC